ncbi:MAG: class I SAM-dependent methyltransferase [Planctomycetes bacterium]|nr:class I SAM-dependent methyltransferase [Planctomycetota bacterium]
MKSPPFDDRAVVERYEEWYSTPFGRLADELETRALTDLLGPPPPGGTLLEIGCGTAHFGAAMAQRGWKVTGVDPSREMAAIARSRVSTAMASGESLPFGDASFDATFLVAVLDFVPDPTAVLREALRAARTRAVVLALNRRSWLATWRRVAAMRGHRVFSRARFYSISQIEQFIRDAGGQPVRRRGMLFLPPAAAGAIPSLERALARRLVGGGGVVGWQVEKLVSSAAG